MGREVSTLINEKLNPGIYEVDFDGSKMVAGTYFDFLFGIITGYHKQIVIYHL